MRDGTCLVTFVAGVSFLLLMELSRMGAFNGLRHAISAEFSPQNVSTSQTTAAAGAKSVAPRQIATANESAQDVPVTHERTARHQTRTRERLADRG
jgi:hypothetical protein